MASPLASSAPAVVVVVTLVAIVYASVGSALVRRIDPAAETMSVVVQPARNIVMALGVAFSLTLFAEQLALAEEGERAAGNTVRWVRTFVVLTAALHGATSAWQVVWLTRTALVRWRQLGEAALLRFHGVAPTGDGTHSGGTGRCRRRGRGDPTDGASATESDSDSTRSGTEAVLHWPLWASNELPWSCCTCTRRGRAVRRAVEVARWHAQRRLFLRSTQLPPHFDVTRYLRQQLSQYCATTSLALPGSAWSMILLGAIIAAAIDIPRQDGSAESPPPFCANETRLLANGTVDSASIGTVGGALGAAVWTWLLLIVHFAALLSLRSRRNRWLVLWGAPAPAHLDAALSAPPAPHLTATVAQTSASIAGPWLWRWTRVAEQLGRLGQCAVLSEWLLTDYRFSFAHSLCGEEAVDCGDSEALSAMGGGGACPAALVLHMLLLLPTIAALFGPASFNRALPEAASLLRSLAEPDANAVLEVTEGLHRLDTARVSFALAIGASAEPDLSTSPGSGSHPPVRLRWAKKRAPAPSTMKDAAEALASERRPEPAQLARTEAEGGVARLFAALGASSGNHQSTISLVTLHRALPRLGLYWSTSQWEAVQRRLLATQTAGPAAAATADDDNSGVVAGGGAPLAVPPAAAAAGGGGSVDRRRCGPCGYGREDPDDDTAKETQLMQSTVVEFLMAPTVQLLTSDDPVTDVATGVWKHRGSTDATSEAGEQQGAGGGSGPAPAMSDDGDASAHESHVVNPLVPILVHRQQAEAAANADAIAAAEAAEKAGMRLGFQKSLVAGGSQAGGMVGRFRKGESHRTDAEVEADVRGIWRRLDRDGSNSLSRPEVAVLLLELTGEKPSEQELSKAFAVLDADGSGDVTWSEFFAWWQSQDPAAQAQLMLLNELSFDMLMPAKTARAAPAGAGPR
jgi:hypothetical protein